MGILLKGKITVDMMAGAQAAILDHEENLENESHTLQSNQTERDRVPDTVVCHANSRLPASGLLKCEREIHFWLV